MHLLRLILIGLAAGVGLALVSPAAPTSRPIEVSEPVPTPDVARGSGTEATRPPPAADQRRSRVATTIAVDHPVGLPTSTAPTASTTSPPVDDRGPAGSGVFVAAVAAAHPIPGEPMITFSVAAEEGTGVDPDELAALVDETLADPRGWTSTGTGFTRVGDGGDFTLVVAAPATVDRLCTPLRTNGIFSCARNGWIAVNLVRWTTATSEWPADLDTYRRYVVNHEIGHYLRGPAHESCPAADGPAPIMMQQTKGLDGCAANGWVDP